MISVAIGQSAPLSFTDALGNPVPVFGAIFTVAPPGVGSVTGSVFTALSRGAAQITALLTDGSTASAGALVVPATTLTLIVGTPS